MPLDMLDFNQRMRDHGFRVTPQRKVIIQAIWDNGEHAEIEMILADVKMREPAISPATVYRTIDLFIESKLVIANRVGRKTVYEIASDHPHHHLLCRKCGHDQRVDLAQIHQLVDEIDREYHFVVEAEHLILPGICGHCQNL